MKPAPFDYHRASSLDEALRILSERPDARPIAGGQSLGPMLNLRLAAPPLVVDISGLAELRTVDSDGTHVRIGAGIRHADVEDGRIPPVLGNMLPRIARGIAYRAVRNRGTVGGSLAHADPAADWPPVLIALGAEAEVRSARGTRTVPCRDLIAGAMETSLAPDELIEAIRIPLYDADASYGHQKIARKPGDFAESLAVAVVDRSRGTARVVLSGHAQTARLLPETSAALANGGVGGGEAAIESDLDTIGKDEDPGPYLMALHRASVERAVAGALDR